MAHSPSNSPAAPPAPPVTRIPSPAIVAQEAVRRLPRWALITLCAAYTLAGLIGREPWKNADLAGFGLLLDVLGTSQGAWLLVRAGAAALLGLTCAATWYATYYLARRKQAQPVPFAFGGEAHPADYARAIADGALLALLACLGLAQLGHETTLSLVQMSLTAVTFFALSAYAYHPITAGAALLMGCTGLFFTLQNWSLQTSDGFSLRAWRESLHMLVWFTWPAWVLATLALVKWRRHWLSTCPSFHIALPLVFVVAFLVPLPMLVQKDRWFLSALPPLAALAAFALPTLKRGMKSLIDLFTLIFFSGCAFIIWVVWIAMQTGIPPQPAANVARLLPHFTPSFSAPVLLLALAATLAWGMLVYWRLGKHRPAIWMSMVLPASGAAVCWALLMSLWLPLLDHARSYEYRMGQVASHIAPRNSQQTTDEASCIHIHGIDTAQQAALRYYLHRPLIVAHRQAICPYLMVGSDAQPSLPELVTLSQWQLAATIRRLKSEDEDWLIYQRRP